MKIGKGNASLGLDIGSHYVKLVELCENTHGIQVTNCQIEELPHEAIVDKQIMDREIVVQKVQDLLKTGKYKNRPVNISVAGRGVIIKKIVTDSMNAAELDDAMEWEAKQHIPFDISEVSMDYQTITSENAIDHTDVLLVAAKNDLVYSGSDLSRTVGLIPHGIDLDTFAVQNALYHNQYIPKEGTVAVLHIGYNTTSATIICDGAFEANHDLPVTGKLYLENIVQRLGISIEEGFKLLWNGSSEEHASYILNDVIQSSTGKLVGILERAFPQHWARDAQMPVSKVILCGGGACYSGLKDYLQEHLNIQVVIANPLKELSRDTNLPKDLQGTGATGFTLAVGLALEGLDVTNDNIHFNLLPSEDRAKERFSIIEHRNLIIPVALSALFLVGATIETIHQNSIIGGIRDDLAILNQESTVYQEKINLVEEITAKRNDIMARVKIIESLDRDRFLRVHFLDELNRLLPTLTWLEGISESGIGAGAYTIEGVTTNNLKVSELMSNLITSDLFESVDLTVTQQKEIAHQEITTFTIQIKLKGVFAAAPVVAETK